MRHLEEDLQMACVRWFGYLYPGIAPLLHHSPNGGKRNVREAARFKAMGTRAGFPDLILLMPNKKHPFLCIELKAGKGKQTELQKNYQRIVQRVGARYDVVRTLNEFTEIINNYLKDKD